MEAGMVRICQGLEEKGTFLNNIRSMYERMFNAINSRQDSLVESWNRYLSQPEDGDDGNNGGDQMPPMTRDSDGNDDDDENDGNNNQRRRQRRQAEEKPKCQCELIAAKKRVSKDGPTKGRYFWTCTKTANSCRFFQWAEEVEQHEDTSNNRPRGRGSSSKSKGTSKRGRGSKRKRKQ